MNLLTEIREGFGISWAAIRANKLRSILTTLGIVIGIVTVTLMGTAIEGLNQSFMSSISTLGADVFFVSRDAWFNNNEGDWNKSQRRRPLKLADAVKVAEQLTLSSAVAPVAERGAQVEFQRRSSGRVRVVGTTEQYLMTSGVGMSAGHFFSAAEAAGGRPVCVIGTQVATNLFGTDSPLGQRIKIGPATFEVVGVLEKQGSFMGIFSLDNQAMLPIQQFMGTFWNNPDITIQVKARQLAELEEAREELRHTMRKIRRLAPSDPDDFAINQQEQFVQMFHRVAGTIAAVGFFITGLSLFVGGIGIMNIMFVSVAERTREIGIRKAIGAKRRTILLQFLTEAGCICLMGGLIALAIAWPLTLVMQKFLPASMSLAVAGVALLVSLVTGVVSGFLPAWRAARMNPVDALRSE
ncbi:MAG: FtsX-like permease family protein [Verrucomicrobiales bacterium]|nr:MAG: FtsX-like permease family protein [Verrucomicrobiales bacterium]